MEKLKDKKAIILFVVSIILAMTAGVFAVYGNMLWIVTLIVSQVILILAVLRVVMKS